MKEESVEERVCRGEFFHGRILEEEGWALLKQDGDFILRESIRPLKANYEIGGFDCLTLVLMVRWGEGQKGERDYRFKVNERARICLDKEGEAFDGPLELIVDLWKKGGELPDQASLKNPIGLQSWELLDHEIGWEKKKLIGGGAFGTVFRLKYSGRNGNEPFEVALKVCEETKSTWEKRRFLNEGRMLRIAGSEFVVRLIGICTLSLPMKMAMELIDGGDLIHWLQETGKRAEEGQLVRFAHDTALGFAHLASLHILHLDIAARNCLLKTQPGGLTRAIVSDLGLSQFGPEYHLRDGGDVVASRWAAPELLSEEAPKIATSKSDVWSYGILLFEIFSGGMEPYWHMRDCSLLVVQLDHGLRNPIPERTPKGFVSIIGACGEWSPSDRPTFQQIVDNIAKIEEEFKSEAVTSTESGSMRTKISKDTSPTSSVVTSTTKTHDSELDSSIDSPPTKTDTDEPTEDSGQDPPPEEVVEGDPPCTTETTPSGPATDSDKIETKEETPTVPFEENNGKGQQSDEKGRKL